MRKSILLSTAVSILLASTAVAQDGTDTCTTPTAIGEGTFAFDTSTMVGNDDLPGCNSNLFASSGNFFNQDMFWVYTATAAGDLTLDTSGSTFDTQMAVFSGVDCSATCIDNDDDDGAGLQSLITLTGVSIGEQFLIQVGGYGTDAGVGTLSVSISTPPPANPNNECSTAGTIAGTGAFAYDTTGATSQAFNGGGSPCVTSVNQDIYLQWTAPSDGDFTFDTFGTGYDTKMAVHLGVGCAAVCAAYNDDAVGVESEVSLSGLTMGDPVLIQLGGYLANEGPGTLNITQAPDGTSCALGLPISGAGAFAYDTTGQITTSFNEGACDPVNQDLFYVWTADADGDWSIDTFLTSYDTILAVYNGSDCTATCAASNDDTGGVQSQVILTGLTSGATFLIQVGGYMANEGAGTLTIAPTIDPCDPLLNEDALEDNDTCATAYAITPGVYTSLYCNDTDSDWYSISVPAGNILTVTLTQNSGDTDFNILESDCLTSVGAPFGSWNVNNTGATSLDLVFEAFNYSSAGACSNYDLDISIAPDPCGAGSDDAFEENDDCATATPLSDGTYSGLFVSKTDHDHYAFCVGNGDTLNIDLLFTNSVGDIDAFLRNASSVECGNGNGADELNDGFSSSDNENINWTNLTGADVDVILEVNVWTGSTGGCNNYDMVVTGSGNCNGYLGSMYCTAVPNTTGVTSNIYGTGDIVAANNAFGLLATNLPDGEYGYFIGGYGQDQNNNPGGSTGNLCVGGGQAIARFLPTLGLISGGQIAGSIDLTNVPLPPTLSAMILSGDTFNFQLWHREGGPLSGMSNFSPGLEVTFQ